MTHSTHRIDSLPARLFNRLEWKAAALREQGVDVIALGFGDPVGPTPQPIVEATKAALDDPASHHYTTNRGTVAFRQAVALHYQRRFGVAVDPDTEVLPALGAKECIFNLNLALLDPGDVALAPDPGYQVYVAGPLIVGAHAHPMPLLEENAFLPDLAAIPGKVLDRAKVLYLNYPNSPTGALAPLSFFADAVALAQERGIVIVHDNVYSEVAFDGRRAPSILEVPHAKDVAVEVLSWSKSYRMTGWRCAALAGNAEVVERYRTVKSFVDSGMFIPLQVAGAAALEPDLDQYLTNEVVVYQRRRDLVCAKLTDLGFNVKPPQGSVYVWARIPDGFGTSDEMCERILDEAGVALSSGAAYGAYGEGYVRVSLTVPDERLVEALERIAIVMGS
jgi:LL-diaminopimelate aminotransferase